MGLAKPQARRRQGNKVKQRVKEAGTVCVYACDDEGQVQYKEHVADDTTDTDVSR